MPLCSVIIPVYNLAAITRRCLDHLLARPPETCDLEVIVVDDASRDSTPRLLAGYGDRVRVVTHPRNLGFATGCNDGAAVASGDFLVFLNNDTVPMPGWLDALVDHARTHPEAGAVGSKLLYADGTIQHAGVVIDRDRIPRHIYVGFPGDHPAVNKSRRFQVVTGGCVLFPRDVFERAGGFDTGFINGYEDVDLCLRIGVMGREVRYCHESVLFHLESVSEGRGSHHLHNSRLLAERWQLVGYGLGPAPRPSPSRVDRDEARGRRWVAGTPDPGRFRERPRPLGDCWGHRVRTDDWQYYLDDGLIEIQYTPSCPLEVRVSPLLGIIDADGRCSEADHLLALRARQVRDLLKENTDLLVQKANALSI